MHAPVGLEPTISTGERPQTYVLDRAATGTGTISIYLKNIGDVWDQTSGFLIPGYYSLKSPGLFRKIIEKITINSKHT
jgi:hypothetical protein